MLVARPTSRRNPRVQKRLRLFRAVVLRQGLCVHLIAGHVIRICFQ